MHKSIFSYQLSRPYPYRWFTWVVFIGGAFATVIFSIINFEAAGFDIVTQYTSNTTEVESPNATAWYQRPPWSLASKIKPTCLAQVISVGSTYYTDNQAFAYTVQAMSTITNNQTSSIMSQAYKTVPLTNCILTTMDLLAVGTLQLYSPVDYAASYGPFDVTVNLNCSMQSIEHNTTLHLTAEFLVGSDTGFALKDGSTHLPFDSVENANETSPALSFGGMLARAYTDSLYDPFGDVYTSNRNYTNHSNTNYTMHITWSNDGPGRNGIDTISSGVTITNSGSFFLGVFVSDLYSPLGASDLSLSSWSVASFQDESDHVQIQYNDANGGMEWRMLNTSDPRRLLGLFSDQINRVLYWSILTDLGQSATNMFADPHRLMDHLIESVNYTCSTSVNGTLMIPYLDELSRYIGCDAILPEDLNVTSFYRWLGYSVPSVSLAAFALEYTCQVPKQKPAGALIISILVADLVFLQALWKVLNWLTTLILNRRDHRANHCPGCEELLLRSEEGIELRNGTDLTDVDVDKGNNEPLGRNGESSSLSEHSSSDDHVLENDDFTPGPTTSLVPVRTETSR